MHSSPSPPDAEDLLAAFHEAATRARCHGGHSAVQAGLAAVLTLLAEQGCVAVAELDDRGQERPFRSLVLRRWHLEALAAELQGSEPAALPPPAEPQSGGRLFF